MDLRSPAQPYFGFELATFLAVLVIAIILIFICWIEAMAMKSMTDAAVASCVWRGAILQSSGGGVGR